MTDEQKKQITKMRNEGMGYQCIASALSLSKDTVKTFCRRNDLMGTRGSKSVQIQSGKTYCRACGKELIQISRRKPRNFCSAECRIGWWNSHPEKVNKKAIYSFTCDHCGKPFTSYGVKERKYCSRDCYIAARFGKAADDNTK